MFQVRLENASNEDIRRKILELIESVIPLQILPSKDEILINPTGRFVVGGPDGDVGLTGRKLLLIHMVVQDHMEEELFQERLYQS